MNPRQRNLLEAFKDAGEALPAGSPSSGGPFAGPRKVEEDPGPPPAPIPDVDTDVPKATWGEVFEELPPWLPSVVALVVVFLLGIAIGRATKGGAVEAGGGDDPGPRVELESGDRVRIRPEDVPADASALYDPANVFTVILATYSHSDLGKALAWENYDWLKELGYPVFQPVYSGQNTENVVLLAGAQPEKAGLDELLSQIRRQPGKKGGDELPFESAYTIRIESILDVWRDE